MLAVLISLLLTLRDCLRARAVLHLELLALRHQIHVITRSRPLRPRLPLSDRLLWVWLSRVWHGWRSALVIVKPETVIAWHRRGFRLFWRWKSRRRVGRPTVPLDVRTLIRTMSDANPLWGAPRIHGELLKLGIDVCQATVAKYMGRRRRPPSQTWRAFLTNHIGQIMAADFFVVPTATCRALVRPGAPRPRAPTRGACRRHGPSDRGVDRATAARSVSLGRGAAISPPGSRSCVHRLGETATAMDIREILTAPRSPWQNAYAERFIGSVRRECLDHVIVLSASGLRRVLKRVRHLLRTIAHAPLTRQRRADSSPNHSAHRGRRRGDTAGRRPSSPIRTARRLTSPCRTYFTKSNRRSPRPSSRQARSATARGFEMDSVVFSTEPNAGSRSPARDAARSSF